MTDPIELAAPNPPTGFWAGLPTLWRHVREQRELIRELALRDIRLKYRGSAFGYVWSLLEPLLMALVFVAMFALLSRSSGKNATLGVVLGVIVWQYFAIAMVKAQASLTQNAGLIEQIYVPREVFGVAAVIAQLVMAALSLLVAIPFLVYMRLPPTIYLLYVPLGMVLVTAFALGLGMGSAPWNVLNRDVEYFTSFLTRAGMYLSPVMWSVHTIPANAHKLKAVILFNPLVVPMEMIKSGIAGQPLAIGTPHVVYACASCVVALVLGLATFRKMEGLVVKKL